ncbi:MAG: macro domain-containing protein [Desulfosporosinus sp.]|nr:macro domain-containing protein [Desulfosporosinus sp.]
MSCAIIKGDITEIEADIIVNASNGIGYMGGFLGRYIKLKGVAEAIHYKTSGKIEIEAKKVCRTSQIAGKKRRGIKAGDIFVTGAANLNAKYIIHAVTMWFPGTKSNIKVVEALLPKICEKSRELGVKTIALPLLGTGTGKVNQKDVLDLYMRYFSSIEDLDIKIIVNNPHLKKR